MMEKIPNIIDNLFSLPNIFLECEYFLNLLFINDLVHGELNDLCL